MRKGYYLKEKNPSIRKKIDVLVNILIKHGFTSIEIERCLGLESSALTQSDDPALLSLLKIICLYPWMIRVAERNYDVTEARRMMCHAAIDSMFDTGGKGVL
jgi:hypothetical protein